MRGWRPGRTIRRRTPFRENDEPVKRKRTERGEPILPWQGLKATPALLNWQQLVRKAAVSGPVREFAVSSELVELTDSSVLLRPRTRAMAAETVRARLQEALQAASGGHWTVQVTPDLMADPETVVTVGRLEDDERRRTRRALIDAFKSDPIVQKCLRLLDGTLDDTSVRSLTTEEKKELEDYARKYSGTSGSGSEDAEKR